MNKTLVTGGSGLVGRAFQRLHPEFIYPRKVDLTDPAICDKLFWIYKPAAVIHLAAKVGGVAGNSAANAEYFRQNTLINTNVLSACEKYKVGKVVAFLSSCVYPQNARLPLIEEDLHAGEPHPTNFGYAFSKRSMEVYARALRQDSGLDTICVIPNNLYGIHDKFDLTTSHVIPAMIRKFFEAKKQKKEVVLWGDGDPLREFTFVDDIPRVVDFLLEKKYSFAEPINIGNTEEITIRDLALKIKKVSGFEGDIIWDPSYPNGIKRKATSNNKLLSLGWDASAYTKLDKGLRTVWDWYSEENA